MLNNDVFRKLIYLTQLDRKPELIVEVFKMGGIEASTSKVKNWRRMKENDRFSHMPDEVLNGFFDGLFLYRTQQKEKGIDIFNFEQEKSRDKSNVNQ